MEETLKKASMNFSRAYFINRRTVNFGSPVNFRFGDIQDMVWDLFFTYDYSKNEVVRYLPIMDECGSLRFEPIYGDNRHEFRDESEWVVLGEKGVYLYNEVEFIN